ncbi:MAG: hypothetical protein ACRD0K_13220 [Egibacteraceae bacterium]
MAQQIDLDAVAELLARLDAGDVGTRPVSVALPVPLAEALRLLVEAGLLPSTSAAASAQLERVARNLVLRLQLDDVYRQHPDLRPSEEAVAAVRLKNRAAQGKPAA